MASESAVGRESQPPPLNTQSNNRATMTSASIPLVDLSEDNEVSVVTRWDIELRKKGSYKIAASILSGRKFGAPSLAVMREWLDVIVHQPFQDFFINNSEQAKSFDDLKKVSVFKCTSKTARFRKWTVTLYLTRWLS